MVVSNITKYTKIFINIAKCDTYLSVIDNDRHILVTPIDVYPYLSHHIYKYFQKIGGSFWVLIWK